jgi:hypothetical protein
MRIYTMGLMLMLGITLSAFKKDKSLGIWKEKQLVTVESVVERLKKGDTSNLLILNTGPVENIPTALTFGAVENEKNLAKLVAFLDTLPRSKEVLLYCGCCPLSVCPNLEPAYKALGTMKFKNFKIIKLIHDLQEDWIDKGYPIAE